MRPGLGMALQDNDCSRPTHRRVTLLSENQVQKRSTEDRSMRVCLLGASLNTGNMGVSALAAGTVTSALSAFPDGRVFLLDYGREPANYVVQGPTGPVGVELVNIRFSKKFFLRNNIARLLAVAFFVGLLPHRKWRRFLLERNPYLKRILDADVVASIAGGDSFSDIYGFSRLLYVALPQLLVLELGKSLVLLPQTLGPFRSIWAKLIARHILRKASVVYSRDLTSLQETEKLLGRQKGKSRFSHDMAFVLEPVKPEAAKLEGLPSRDGAAPLVGINISGLLLMGGYSRDNMFGLKPDYARLLREVIEYFVQEHGANVLLVPHVFGEGSESDSVACAALYDELRSRCGGRLYLLPGTFNQHEIKYVVGQCDFFIGSRMHACIAAVSQSVPAVCLAYSRKFIGVMESIGCAELVVDLCKSDNEAALGVIRHVFATRSRVRDVLHERIPKAREAVLNLFLAEGIAAGADRNREGRTAPRTAGVGHSVIP